MSLPISLCLRAADYKPRNDKTEDICCENIECIIFKLFSETASPKLPEKKGQVNSEMKIIENLNFRISENGRMVTNGLVRKQYQPKIRIQIEYKINYTPYYTPPSGRMDGFFAKLLNF